MGSVVEYPAPNSHDARMLACILDLQAREGRSPTYGELQTALSLPTQGGLTHPRKRLVEAGLIVRNGRETVVTEVGHAAAIRLGILPEAAAVVEPASPGLPFHPLANLFPLIEGRAFDELVADIAANGVRDPIVLLDGMILDGRNRYRAALAAGVLRVDDDPDDSMLICDLGPGVDPLGYVISANLHRRHLTESQRAMVAARIATLPVGRPAIAEPKAQDSDDTEAAGNAANLPDSAGVAQGDAARLMHVSERSVRTARHVIEHGVPELVARVEQGTISVHAASAIAEAPAAEQRRVIDADDPAAIRKAAAELRARQTEEKKAKRAERERALGERIAAGGPALAAMAASGKRYGVVLADPEWRFEPYSRDTGMDRAADNHYPTTPTLDIISRPVASIAADDAVLFLWATAPMLPQALAVMKAWGFAYKTNLVWDKMRAGTGYWFRNRHEHLLVGTRGQVPAPAMGTQWASVLEAMAAGHSAKPAEVYDLIEQYFPTLPKIELNARAVRPGWDVWGAEAPDAPEARE